MNTYPLTEGWSLEAAGGQPAIDLPAGLPAEVPGSVHTDLLRAGLIPDPYLDANEAKLSWMHHMDWRYQSVLQLDPADAGERVDLVFEGIDTIGTVALEGQELGRTANMHRSYRFDVREYADGKPRRLAVTLASATAYAQAQRERLGDRPSAYHPVPFNFIRKMACSFGWDWGPDLRTAGLYKPVLVHRWKVARLAQVRPLVTVDAAGTGQIEVQVDVQRSGLQEPGELELAASILGASATVRIPAHSSQATLSLAVPQAPLWWPAGYGAQPLHELQVALGEPEGTQPLDHWARRVGFRTIELDTSEDEHGTAFLLKVNGQPVFIKGANWIPDDHLLTRITRERIERRLDQALGANLNLLRVWGGGIYESEDFYTACSERGLLVWQDFLLACAAYPEEEPFTQELAAEARENVVRLMPHPSLAIWNGGNENVWGHEDWEWKQALDGRSWGGYFAHEMLREIVAELDPTRPYCDNSPYTPHRAASELHPNHPDHGTHHQWEVWNRIDYLQYRSDIPRFCSEFGFQGPPTWRTLGDWVHNSDGGPLAQSPDPSRDPVFLVHQKADDGNAKLERGLAAHLGVPADFEHWHWATQLNQARAVRYAIEHYRSWWPRTAGAIVWQLNDCWPVTSWAAVDSEERPKPLWHALRLANAPRMLSFGERDGQLHLSLVNDHAEPWASTLSLSLQGFDGKPRHSVEQRVLVPARSVQSVSIDPALCAPGQVRNEVLVATVGQEHAVHLFAPDVELSLDPAPLRGVVRELADGYEVRVSALSLALDATLLVDRVHPEASVEQGLVSLPAGAEASFVVRCPPLADPQQLLSPSVLRTANDLRAVELSHRSALAGATQR